MSDVYKIGVRIALSNGVSPVLGVIAKDLLGIHSGVDKLEKGFGRLKLAIGGAVAVAAGVAILGGVYKLTKAAEELSREQGKMAAAGIANKDIATATARAWSMASSIMGTRVADNLRAVAHLRASFGDLGEAISVAPSYQRNAVALGAITGKDGEGEAFKLAQAIHLSGAANDPTTKRLREDLFSRQMNLYTSMIAAGGGKLTAADLLQFQKQAGSYGGSLSNEGRTNLVGLIQAMSGTRAGTMVSTANRALKDGVIQKASLSALERVGLIDPSKVVAQGRGIGNGASPGGSIQFKPGALANEAQFRADPIGWIWATLVPKLRGAGISTTDAQVNWIQHSKLTANVTRLLAEGVRNQGVDAQEARNVRLASGSDQYKAVMGRDLGANVKALGDSFHNLMTALGAPLIKPAIAGLTNLTHAVQAVTKWAVANPKAVAAVAKAAVVLGAALIGFGVVAVGVAAFAAVAASGAVGVAIAAIGAVVAALATFVAFNWDAVGGAVKRFSAVLGDIGGFIAAFAKNPVAAVMEAPARLAHLAGDATGAAGFKAPQARPQHSGPAHVYLDGRRVGRVLDQLHARGSAALGGMSGHDVTMSPNYVANGYGG